MCNLFRMKVLTFCNVWFNVLVFDVNNFCINVVI